MAAPAVWDEDSHSFVHGAAIADPAAPGASYVQAEADAVRDAVVSIIAALESAGILASD